MCASESLNMRLYKPLLDKISVMLKYKEKIDVGFTF